MSEDTRHFAFGECTGCVSQQSFAKRLAELGLRVQDRNYSIVVSEFERLSFEFDQSSEDDATIHGTASTAEVLKANAHRLHEVLTRGGIKHWIEITDSVQNPLEQLSHQWPEEPDPATPKLSTTSQEQRMGKSFIHINGNGFWMRDGILELWLRLAALHLEDQVEDHSPIHTIRNEWLLASRGIFNGAVHFYLEDNISTPEKRGAVIDAIKSLQAELRKSPPKLEPAVLNLLGLSGGFMGSVESTRLLEVGECLLALINGQQFGSSAVSTFMPGSRPGNS
jgi:hypothetical protein